MAVDWVADVKKYVPDADEAAIAGIVRHCGIALRSRDASLVAFSDKDETDRVRTSFLQKKLALTAPVAELDAAIAAVGVRMKADRTKNRVTVYYLLAEHFGKLAMFVKAPKVPAAAAAVAPATTAKPAAKAKAPARKAAKPVAAAAAPAAAVPASAPGGGAMAASAAMAGAAGAAVAGMAAKAVDGASGAAKAAGGAVADVAGGAVDMAKAGGAAVSGAAGAAVAGAGAVGAAAVAGAGAVGAAALGVAGGAAIAVADVAGGAVDATKAAGAAMAGAAGSAMAGVGAAGAAAAGLATGAAGAAGHAMHDAGAAMSGAVKNRNWLWWLLGLLLLAALLYLLFSCSQGTTPVAESTGTPPAAAGTDAAPAARAAPPAEGQAAIPAGEGVTSETRDGKPVVKVYFASGKTSVAPAFAAAAAGLKDWLGTHAGASVTVSGYADTSGNAALNARLAKERATAVKAALISGGMADSAVALVKPADVIDAHDSAVAARRVEVVVK